MTPANNIPHHAPYGTAAVLLDDPGKAVVAAPLLRIWVAELDMVLPEYLNWFISQRDAQIFLTSMAKGTAVKMISKEALEDLEVALPSVEKQKNIVELPGWRLVNKPCCIHWPISGDTTFQRG